LALEQAPVSALALVSKLTLNSIGRPRNRSLLHSSSAGNIS
jgi:hypothetical protein